MLSNVLSRFVAITPWLSVCRGPNQYVSNRCARKIDSNPIRVRRSLRDAIRAHETRDSERTIVGNKVVDDDVLVRTVK